MPLVEFSQYLEEFSQQAKPDPAGVSREPINWWRLSTVLFNTAKLMKDDGKPEKVGKLESLYSQARIIIWFDLRIHASRYLLPALSLFGSYLLVELFVSYIGLPIKLSDRIQSFSDSIILFLVGWCVAFVLFYFFQGITRYFTDKSTTNLDDILVGIISIPVVTIVLAVGALEAISTLPDYFRFWLLGFWRLVTGDGLPILITTTVITYFTVSMFNRVLIYSLQKWAERTKQNYDDLIVQILKIFGSFFIVAISGAILLVDFQSGIKQATGIDNILLPYTIVVSVLTAIIGYSTQEGVQNFFGGLLLQIEKPFDLGDRIVLETGEICDVRSLGIRSTTFYNVLENTEISIPNRLVSNQPITNLSRPNLELRVSTAVHIPLDKTGTSLQLTENVLLDIAAKEDEIDRTWLRKDENHPAREGIVRKSLEERINDLKESYTHLESASLTRLSGKIINIFGKEGIFEKLEETTRLRAQFDEKIKKNDRKSISARYKTLEKIVEKFGEIGELVYAMGSFSTDAKISDIYLNLVDELSIEPSIYSQYMITEEGRAYLEVTLRVYTTHLERRFEVAHKINKQIQKRFKEEGIKILSIEA